MTYNWTTPPPPGETPGETAYRAWWEELNRYHSTDLFHDDWAEITDGAKSGWEAAAEAIKHKYGAIY